MEAQLWKVKWEDRSGKYRLSLLDHPSIKVEAMSIEEAVDLMEERISEELHDPVPHLEFANELPATARLAEPTFIQILAGHDRVEGVVNESALFVNPRCKKCERYFGGRTGALIELEQPPIGDLGFTKFRAQIISETLALELGLDDCSDFEQRPIIIAGEETWAFRELCSVKLRPYVAKRGVKASQGFKCPQCGLIVWIYMPGEAKFLEFISAIDAPNNMDVFAVGTDYRISIAVSEDLRQRIVGSRKFKGVVSRKVGVLDPVDAVPIDTFFV